MQWLNSSILALICLASSAVAVAGEQVPEQLKDVGITEHLGSDVSIQQLTFRDEQGKPVKLGQYFTNGKPVLLSLVYFGCPHLCTFVLNGMVDTLKKLDWTPGKEFEIVSVSIDPTEDAKLASAKKTSYLESLGRPAAGFGWHFLTGEESQIKKLASEVGFGYRYDAQDKQYAHAAALYVLTPEGKISRYLYGIEYSPKDLRLALVEASNGKIGTIVDRLILFCFHYDPHTRKYLLYLDKVMKAAMALTALMLGAYLTVYWRRERTLSVRSS